MTVLSVTAVIFLGAIVPQAEADDNNRGNNKKVPLCRPILVQGRVRARAMRARVAVVIIGGGSGTEPTAVVQQWQSMVVVAMR